MGKKKEIFIVYDKNIKRRERRNRYDLYMKNRPVTRLFQGKEVIYVVNICVEKEGFTQDRIAFVKIINMKMITNSMLTFFHWWRW
ncbi:hypothetical protein [Bacillus wiedmannii]|uniref:hypothetical protein n=1 Tax=Bacillus wiedmannii TaxID=1890302 RepID=UPI000BEF595F|nr:hypothetical protein [Bacillus wiedmannii]PEM53129.1 hypothetical protein CN618_04765 [Bacillus wiedmannii]PEN02023.1 hypothetical protein CN621_08065 [Bacillus wiedmannii]PGA00997.1 hypothetical protein COL78_04960 [Bacillus wiedmannii]PHD23743.1 hypothetical protein COF58_18815 [Bacillus wiedmannii]PHF01773.1 hypothetical protein COF76_06900 [Bacillus wiedmannii]